MANANVEVWHCDSAGNYSEYGTQTAQTYLRGIQTTNSSGEVTFTTIYPGWYQGTGHAHSPRGHDQRRVAQDHADRVPREREQRRLPTGVYASRGANPTSNLSDGIFADSLSSELVTPPGMPTNGYTASCQIAVSL